MKPWNLFIALGVALLLTAAPGGLRAAQEGQGQAVVTVLPHNKEAAPTNVNQQDLAVRVDGKPAQVTNWTQDGNGPLELVLLIDGSARESLGREMGEMSQFIRTLPPNVKVGVAYMAQGEAMFAEPLTADHAKAAQGLHMPGGMPGTEASPYFCLSDLAKHWPSQDASARREVVMITDGVDRYELRYNPDDPYMQAAITDSIRAHMVVYSIYWVSQGRIDATGYENDAGQNLLLQLTTATGGKSYWLGAGNPVTFEPYFEDLLRRFQNQYELGVSAPVGSKPEMASMKVRLSAPGSTVSVPNQIYMKPGQ